MYVLIVYFVGTICVARTTADSDLVLQYIETDHATPSNARFTYCPAARER